METPLCSMCVKSEILCSGCNARLEDGDLTEADVELSRYLFELAESNKALAEAEISRFINTEKALVIVAQKGDAAKVVGREGRIVKKLVEKSGKPVRVIEEGTSPEETAKNLLMPVPVKSVNILYTPEGEERKVVVERKHQRRVQMKQADFRELMKELTGEKFTLSFE